MADATTTTATPPIPVSAQAKEAETKAVAKVAADATVASDPNAVHAVKLTIKSPKVWASAATGAALGSFIPGAGTVAGAAIGGTLGFLAERHQVLGGPVGKAYDKVKSLFAKEKA